MTPQDVALRLAVPVWRLQPTCLINVSKTLAKLSASLVAAFGVVRSAEHYPRARVKRPVAARGFRSARSTWSTGIVGANWPSRRHAPNGGAISQSDLLAGTAQAAIWLGGLLAREKPRLEERVRS